MSRNEMVVKRINDLRTLIYQPGVRKQLALVAPKHFSVDRLLRVVMTAVQRNPRIADCTPDSVIGCLMGCSELGLEPTGYLGQAYIVPYKNKAGQLIAQLIPGYRGYISLARRTGDVMSVASQGVFENDHFVLQYGTEERLEHIPTQGEPGKQLGAYVFFRFKDGGHSFDYMTISQIEKIRKRSKTPNEGPWVTDYVEMSKKTVIRRHAKITPMSIEYSKAAAFEDRALAGESQLDLIENLDLTGIVLPSAEGSVGSAASTENGPTGQTPEGEARAPLIHFGNTDGKDPGEEEQEEERAARLRSQFSALVWERAKGIEGMREPYFAFEGWRLIDEFIDGLSKVHGMTQLSVIEASIERFDDFWDSYMKKYGSKLSHGLRNHGPWDQERAEMQNKRKAPETGNPGTETDGKKQEQVKE